MKRRVWVTLSGFFLLSASSPAQAQFNFCSGTGNPPWCAVIHQNNTFDKDKTQCIEVRSWSEYVDLHKYLVKSVAIMPGAPVHRAEDDSSFPEPRKWGVRLEQLDQERFLVLAVAVKKDPTLSSLYELLSPKLESGTLAIPIRVTAGQDAGGSYAPLNVRGGSYWIVATTPALLRILQISSTREIRNIQLKLEGSEEKILDCVPISNILRR
ncbi:MAG TPA: hypothetical protein VI895_12435 [Bdellovibrionota bacterium]|nr:hypothetical protein [Bdellovibrionota bacterium]